jgi:hypothetical protein
MSSVSSKGLDEFYGAFDYTKGTIWSSFLGEIP